MSPLPPPPLPIHPVAPAVPGASVAGSKPLRRKRLPLKSAFCRALRTGPPAAAAAAVPAPLVPCAKAMAPSVRRWRSPTRPTRTSPSSWCALTKRRTSTSLPNATGPPATPLLAAVEKEEDEDDEDDDGDEDDDTDRALPGRQ